VVDPFQRLSENSDSLNPFDMLLLPGFDAEDDAEALAWDLGSLHSDTRDPFWQHGAVGLLSGMCSSAGMDPDPEARNLGSVIDTLLSDEDPVEVLQRMMLTNKIYGEFARARIGEFLSTPDSTSGATRKCILAFARQYLQPIQSARVRRTVERSTLRLDKLYDGNDPMAWYFVLPAGKARSHRGLSRMWMNTIFRVLAARRRMPHLPTWVIIDEASNQGRNELIPMMHTYIRKFGVSIVTLFQSGAQLQDTYPNGEWRTMVENCSTIQAFRLLDSGKDTLSGMLGVPPRLLQTMGPDEQLVVRPEHGQQIMRLIDYRTHPVLASRAAVNPRYSTEASPTTEPAA
jgi:type IV secretion system protein VirD4